MCGANDRFALVFVGGDPGNDPSIPLRHRATRVRRQLFKGVRDMLRGCGWRSRREPGQDLGDMPILAKSNAGNLIDRFILVLDFPRPAVAQIIVVSVMIEERSFLNHRLGSTTHMVAILTQRNPLTLCNAGETALSTISRVVGRRQPIKTMLGEGTKAEVKPFSRASMR